MLSVVVLLPMCTETPLEVELENQMSVPSADGAYPPKAPPSTDLGTNFPTEGGALLEADRVRLTFDDLETLPDVISVVGQVEVSTELAFSGDRSLKVSGGGEGYNRNFATIRLGNEFLQKKIYGRMMVWLDESEYGDGGDFTYVQADGPPQSKWIAAGASEDTRVMYRGRVSDYPQDGTFMSNYDTWIDNDGDGYSDWVTNCWVHSETKFPSGEWVCVEWKFDSEASQIKHWLNGKEIKDITVTGSGDECVSSETQQEEWTAPTKFVALHVGIEQYSSFAVPQTMFIDDMVVGASHVGCPNEVP
ncbi:MAG: hypothetical protein KTR25_16555 [Myxococcales bacterium]|nr:hypothetical protein [Myxococcales bacterium]